MNRKSTLSKIHLLLLFVFMLPVSLWAQNTIKGRVVDADNSEALIGAAIRLSSDKSIGTVSKADGSFELKVGRGKYLLLFSYVGYEDLTQEVNVNGSVDLGTIEMSSASMGLSEVAVVASYATDRKTPVAISNIPATLIAEKLGNQEFVEILKSTPSVYATKQGGGFGDSRINIRGFNTSNIGVLINGVPVNDMVNGKVYFSNWAGLSDVTSVTQVQRGLGASKMAISSVGGTMNIITKSADAKKGGSAYIGMGNDGYQKASVNVSTGMMDNGWAITMLGSRVLGDGYINGTEFEGYNYFLNVTKVLNDRHRLSFQIFGAPQWHNQRGSQHTIAEYKNMDSDSPFTNPWGTKLNSETGVRNGEVYNSGYGYNYYHKPQMSINHYWDINNTTKLSTSVYASIATGGGRRLDGDKDSEVDYSYRSYQYGGTKWRTGDGLVDWDKMIAHNAAKNGESDFFIGNTVNNHQWYGLLTTLNKKFNNYDFTVGYDARFYWGEHYQEIEDLLGGQYYTTKWNVNIDENTPLREGDKYSYWNDEQILRNGLFVQGEYSNDIISGFISGTVSYQNTRRIDYYTYEPGNQVSDWQNFVDWSIKGGANYNFDAHHNVFINAGYFTRAPFQNQIFNGYTNEPAKNRTNEKVMTFEGGYGYKSHNMNIKIGYYWTEWRDQGLRRSFVGESFNIKGVNSRHQGIEMEATYKPTTQLTLKGMASFGFWKYINDVSFQAFDDSNNLLGEFHAYLKDVSVGNSAQNTAALNIDYKFFKSFNIGVGCNYFGKNFADFNITNRTSESTVGIDSWQIPDAVLFDLNLGYNFKIGKLDSRISGNVFNLLDTEYITDATDGTDHDWKTSGVYYGFGRTFSLGMKVNF